MAAWSVPNTITGTTLVNQTDDLIQGNFDDLENYVNSATPYVAAGLAENQTNLVNITAAQTVTGAKTFSATITASNGLTGNVTGNVTGNSDTATTATALATARTISLTGDATGSATFNGSANISITASVSALAGKAALAGSPTQSFSAVTASVGTNTTQVATTAFVQAAMIAVYPVGAIFISTVSTNPNTLFGFGTWAAFAAGRTLVGLTSSDADFDTSGETGGAKTHTLTTAEMPSHQHDSAWGEQGTGEFGNAPNTSARGSASTDYDNNSYYTSAVGGGGAHNNLPPYIVTYMWKRTA